MIRQLFLALIMGILLSLAVAASAAASYTDSFGHTYSDAQVAALCGAMRPSMAATKPYCNP